MERGPGPKINSPSSKKGYWLRPWFYDNSIDVIKKGHEEGTTEVTQSYASVVNQIFFLNSYTDVRIERTKSLLLSIGLKRQIIMSIRGKLDRFINRSCSLTILARKYIDF